MSRAHAFDRRLAPFGSRLTAAILLTAAIALTPLTGAEVDLAWTPSISPEVTGYRIYVVESDTGVDWTVDAGYVTWFTLTDLIGGRAYRLHATSYDDTGRESGPSNAVEFIAPTARGVQAEIQRHTDRTRLTWQTVGGTVYQVWYCSDLATADWTLVAEILAGSQSLYWDDLSNPPPVTRFYRIVPLATDPGT